MKKHILIIAILMASVVLVSCNQKEMEAKQERITQLEQQNEFLRQEAIEKETSINEFFESFAQIKNNLAEIKLRQNMISEETKDTENIGQDIRAQIENDLTAISALMEDNRRRLVNLNRQIRDSNLKIEEFEKLIASLTRDIDEKNVEITLLRDNMSKLDIANTQLAEAIDRLEYEKEERNQIIDIKTDQLNTAYYVFGTQKELREQEIIDRRGGLLGLRRTTVLKSDLNREAFTRVDISRVDQVFIPGKVSSLLSLHPAGSYNLEVNGEDTSTINIEDPDLFWSTTRYLVVSIE